MWLFCFQPMCRVSGLAIDLARWRIASCQGSTHIFDTRNYSFSHCTASQKPPVDASSPDLTVPKHTSANSAAFGALHSLATSSARQVALMGDALIVASEYDPGSVFSLKRGALTDDGRAQAQQSTVQLRRPAGIGGNGFFPHFRFLIRNFCRIGLRACSCALVNTGVVQGKETRIFADSA